MEDVLLVPMILLLVIVVPLWLLLHYVTRWRTERQADGEPHRGFGDHP
jgi:phage shock protein B